MTEPSRVDSWSVQAWMKWQPGHKRSQVAAIMYNIFYGNILHLWWILGVSISKIKRRQPCKVNAAPYTTTYLYHYTLLYLQGIEDGAAVTFLAVNAVMRSFISCSTLAEYCFVMVSWVEVLQKTGQNTITQVCSRLDFTVKEAHSLMSYKTLNNHPYINYERHFLLKDLSIQLFKN